MAPFVAGFEKFAEPGRSIVGELHDVLASSPATSRPQIVAANIQTVEQVVNAFTHGATEVVAPLAVLQKMLDVSATDDSITEFEELSFKKK